MPSNPGDSDIFFHALTPLFRTKKVVYLSEVPETATREPLGAAGQVPKRASATIRVELRGTAVAHGGTHKRLAEDYQHRTHTASGGPASALPWAGDDGTSLMSSRTHPERHGR